MTAALIASAALKGGSMVANSIAQNKIDAARSAALRDQRNKQAALDTQVAGVQADALHPYETFASDNANEASRLAGLYNAGNIGTGTGPVSTIPTNGSAIVNAENAKQQGKASAFATQQGQALADLNATGDTLQNDNLNRARDASRVATLDSFKTGTASVLPYQLDAANMKGSGWKTFGDIMGGVGSLGIAAGLQGAFKPVAGAVPLGRGGIGSDAVASAAPAAASGLSSLFSSFM